MIYENNPDIFMNWKTVLLDPSVSEPESSDDKTEKLIQKAEQAMPYCRDGGDWNTFNRLRSQLEAVPCTYNFVIAGPQTEERDVENLEVDIWSVKGNEYRQFYDYLNTRYGSVLNLREMCAAACLLENVHQHVKRGVGFCVIKIEEGKYKRISVIDNGRGFYNHKKKERLMVRDAVKFGRSYGNRYNSLGQALSLSFGLWSDLSTVETPDDTVIILPEGKFRKMIKWTFRALISLIFALGVNFSAMMLTQNMRMSVIDILIIILTFGSMMQWDIIKSAFGRKSGKKYFPHVKFSIENRQTFGSIVNVYFCDMKHTGKWRRQMVKRLKASLRKRAKFLRKSFGNP